MKKIKICHVVSGLKAGGVESMIYNYCSRLNKKEYEFHILYQHNPSIKNVKEFENLGFKFKKIPSKIKHPIKNYLETLKYFKNNSFDVVHCHMTLMNFIPLIAAKRLKIPVRICHSHNSDVRKKNIFVRMLNNLLKLLCIKYATDLVACGKDAGRYMYGKKKFIIINNALDIKKYEYNNLARKRIRKQFGILDDDILIGHIGRFTNQKNHKFIVEMFKKLVNDVSTKEKNYKLLLIGDGELKNEIEQDVIKNKIDSKVIFPGIINNTNEFYSAMDIFILPSLWEGLPVVGIESQISGLPCLFADTIDKECKINSNVCILNLDIDKWVSCINNIDLRRLKPNMEIINKKNLDIDKEIFKLKKIYSECEKNDKKE